jgi:hypothetical protein
LPIVYLSFTIRFPTIAVMTLARATDNWAPPGRASADGDHLTV